MPLFLLLLFLLPIFSYSSNNPPQVYIVHMDNSKMPAPFSTSHHWYVSMLSAISMTEKSKESQVIHSPKHLYNYHHVINGFSALLSPSHLQQIQRMPGHIATFPDKVGHLHTTHSPRFLGLQKSAGLWPASGFGDDIIIGILDSGIWPESESFNDHGMPPVPPRWKGACETGAEFNTSNCNRKLIGARSFSKAAKAAGLNISTVYDYDSARDFLGHGTHTSSMAAGSSVPCASHFGYAKGRATGMAPKAALAMYKVGFYHNGPSALASDTLAAMDQAIADGVDVMSLSLGFDETQFYQNPIALGAFAAIHKGVFVACAAGNGGNHSIFNTAPWITTVGAGTIDRHFGGRITLGEGELVIMGISLFPANLLVSKVGLYYGNGNRSKETCQTGSLAHKEVQGKYVLCDTDGTTSYQQQVQEIQRSGGVGAVIVSQNWQSIGAQKFTSPFVVLKPTEAGRVKEYTAKARNPTVSVKYQITELGTGPAPQVAIFSSRGPGLLAPWVLKPDLLAPGYNILAGWVPNKEALHYRDDALSTDYLILSGTSMSTPHIAGIAALIKSAHKDWSPAAIKSAMMTTADIYDNTGGPILDMATGVSATPLDFGAGHVNPNKALDPGLVYDISVDGYISFLCGMNYTSQQIAIINRGANFSCLDASLDINYPSFVAISNGTGRTDFKFKRVLTNVEDSIADYTATVVAPPGMVVVVEPTMISFRGLNSKADFTVAVQIKSGSNTSTGYLIWSEAKGVHTVTSPIVCLQ